VEDVQAAVEAAAKFRVPILPRAAGSSLAGQAVNEALVIDMTRYLDRVLEINVEENWVRAQPGLVLDELNLQPGLVLDELNLRLRSQGLQFGPDPASSDRAALGGIVANNSTGSHSILYGMTADHVLETRVILSDGTMTCFGPLEADQLEQSVNKSGLEGTIYQGILEITQNHVDTIRAGTPRHWRRCGGYNLDRFIDGPSFKYPQDPRFNLAKLMCGSEGTLGVITEMKLNLVPLPAKTALAIVHFDTLFEALTATPVILQAEPSAIELLDNLGLSLCRKAPEYSRLLTSFVEGSLRPRSSACGAISSGNEPVSLPSCPP
jgi:FAD/FMN-containing dehydrogenase